MPWLLATRQRMLCLIINIETLDKEQTMKHENIGSSSSEKCRSGDTAPALSLISCMEAGRWWELSAEG